MKKITLGDLLFGTEIGTEIWTKLIKIKNDVGNSVSNVVKNVVNTVSEGIKNGPLKDMNEHIKLHNDQLSSTLSHITKNKKEYLRTDLTNEDIIKRFEIRQNSNFHPYTCMSQTSAGEVCNRNEHDWGNLKAVEKDNKVILECPCGKYTQEVPNEIFDERLMKMFEDSNNRKLGIFNNKE